MRWSQGDTSITILNYSKMLVIAFRSRQVVKQVPSIEVQTVDKEVKKKDQPYTSYTSTQNSQVLYYILIY